MIELVQRVVAWLMNRVRVNQVQQCMRDGATVFVKRHQAGGQILLALRSRNRTFLQRIGEARSVCESKRNAGYGDGESKMAKNKPYDQMSADALARATAEYDKPLIGPGLPGKPLTAGDRATHRRARAHAKAKMGRPVIGEGATIVPVSIERGLLRQVDRFAKRHKLKRSQLVAEGLKMVMAR